MKNHGKDTCTETKTAVSFVILVIAKKGLEANKMEGGAEEWCFGENMYAQDQKML